MLCTCTYLRCYLLICERLVISKSLYFSIEKIIKSCALLFFVMAYIRAKKKRRKKYYYLVEGIREKQEVKQKIIKYLGTIENILEKFKFWEENH